MKETIRHNIIPAILALLIVAPLAWMAADRTLPYEVVGGVTIPAKIQSGGSYKIKWVLRNITGHHCPGTVYTFMRDSKGVIFVGPPHPAAFGLMPLVPNGDTTIYGSPHTVDSAAALGPAQIYISLSLVCNFVQWLWPLELQHHVVDTEIIK